MQGTYPGWPSPFPGPAAADQVVCRGCQSPWPSVLVSRHRLSRNSKNSPSPKPDGSAGMSRSARNCAVPPGPAMRRRPGGTSGAAAGRRPPAPWTGTRAPRRPGRTGHGRPRQGRAAAARTPTSSDLPSCPAFCPSARPPRACRAGLARDRKSCAGPAPGGQSASLRQLPGGIPLKPSSDYRCQVLAAGCAIYDGHRPRIPHEDEPSMPEFSYTDLLPVGPDSTEYRLVSADGISTRQSLGRDFVEVEPGVLTQLTAAAMRDIAHLLRPGHLSQLRSILDDPEASGNDRFVARDLLKNACIAAGGVLPMCQDTGTAIVLGKRGQHVLTDGRDEEHIARGVYDAYTTLNLRYSQLAPLTMWEEKNTGSNLPAQVELYATGGDEYKFLFMAKGGGSANKS